MGDEATKPQRRWIRGTLFWLCVGLSALIAGSWIKSNWRIDEAFITSPAGWGIRFADIFGRLGIVVVADWSDPDPAAGWRLTHQSSPADCDPFGRRQWRTGGFSLRREHNTVLIVPHWFPVLLCLWAAWWASRPWRKRRDLPRGFEVLTTDY